MAFAIAGAIAGPDANQLISLGINMKKTCSKSDKEKSLEGI